MRKNEVMGKFLAAALAASMAAERPAGPAPITISSYLFITASPPILP